MSLTVETGIRGEIWQRSNYDKNKESLYLKYWGINKVNGWAMSLN